MPARAKRAVGKREKTVAQPDTSKQTKPTAALATSSLRGRVMCDEIISCRLAGTEEVAGEVRCRHCGLPRRGARTSTAAEVGRFDLANSEEAEPGEGEEDGAEEKTDP